jgi:hypothetical protein
MERLPRRGTVYVGFRGGGSSISSSSKTIGHAHRDTLLQRDTLDTGHASDSTTYGVLAGVAVASGTASNVHRTVSTLLSEFGGKIIRMKYPGPWSPKISPPTSL